MDPSLLAAFAGAVGLFTGGAAVVAFRASEAERSVAPPTPVPAVPAGVGDVLAVLRSSAVVLDGSDTV
ncbi:MAG: two-component sensor histidine kinase, partial [Actinomycetota bacterium]|nr:two-component sensor histidine kinase [Actinomycetota bacterium]